MEWYVAHSCCAGGTSYISFDPSADGSGEGVQGQASTPRAAATGGQSGAGAAGPAATGTAVLRLGPERADCMAQVWPAATALHAPCANVWTGMLARLHSHNHQPLVLYTCCDLLQRLVCLARTSHLICSCGCGCASARLKRVRCVCVHVHVAAGDGRAGVCAHSLGPRLCGWGLHAQVGPHHSAQVNCFWFAERILNRSCMRPSVPLQLGRSRVA